MSIGENVFERTGPSTMSARGFYGALGLIVAFGLWLSSLVAAEFTAWQPSLMVILLVGLGIPIIGIVIAAKSETPAISFLGYLMVAVPFGMLLGPTLNQYSPEVVQKAMFYTAATTLVMGAAGVLYPNFFARIGGALFMAHGTHRACRCARHRHLYSRIGQHVGHRLYFCGYLLALHRLRYVPCKCNAAHARQCR